MTHKIYLNNKNKNKKNKTVACRAACIGARGERLIPALTTSVRCFDTSTGFLPHEAVRTPYGIRTRN